MKKRKKKVGDAAKVWGKVGVVANSVKHLSKESIYNFFWGGGKN